MSDLKFEVIGARAERYAATPLLMLRLRITESSGARIATLALRAQIQIESRERHYSGAEEGRLYELFDTPSRWGQTQRTLLWTHVSAMVPEFEGSVEIDLPVPCTYDFEVASSKYLDALRDGEIPVTLLFSGTLFTRDVGGFGAEMIPWEKEARCRIPVAAYREALDAHFPNSAWIRVRRESFDVLYEFKARKGLRTWDEALDALIASATAAAGDAP
ncbi:MAG: DUF6084 family protein [Candidatus Eremiobacteraeota bacterium]|nr:DUF6084 family protein [Candidatus Eremiobacteraeota bacterium]